jgi:hypothetical protein
VAANESKLLEETNDLLNFSVDDEKRETREKLALDFINGKSFKAIEPESLFSEKCTLKSTTGKSFATSRMNNFFTKLLLRSESFKKNKFAFQAFEHLNTKHLSQQTSSLPPVEEKLSSDSGVCKTNISTCRI